MRAPESDELFHERSERYFERAAFPINQRIRAHLDSSDDIFSIVIKGHVIIVELLEIAIRTQSPILWKFKRQVRDDLNSRVAMVTELYPEARGIREISKSLGMLNKLRNGFAHSLDQADTVTSEELQKFITEVMRARGFEKLSFDDQAGQVRQCIFILSSAIGETFYGAPFLMTGPENDIYGKPIKP